MPSGVRAAKPPTRRQLAGKILEAIPVINAQAHGLDVVIERLAKLEGRIVGLETGHNLLTAQQHHDAESRWSELRAFIGQSFWQRLRWLFLGR
jgi:hypothetical protein